jgi:IS5 family transposase
MKQQTLAMAADQGAGFETRRKRTRHDEFLDTMNTIVPWTELCAVIEPYYPKRGNGRPPIGLERMLRIHFVQHEPGPAARATSPRVAPGCTACSKDARPGRACRHERLRFGCIRT